MKQTLKAGIIGLGNVGFRYTKDPLRKWVSSHLEAYLAHKNFVPVAACDINTSRLKDAKKYCPSLKTYISWKKMLASENLDVLSVCVSPEMNRRTIFSPYISKLKAIIFEKPFSSDYKTGEKMEERIRKLGVVALVNYFRRWQKTFLKAKKLVASGSIGKLQKVNGRYATGLLNGGVHLIDTILWLVGDITKIQALERSRISGGNDFSYTAFGKIRDIEVFLTGFSKKSYNIFEIEIWGEKGKILISDYGTRITVSKAVRSKRFNLQKELKIVKIFKMNDLGSNFMSLLDNVYQALKKSDKKKIYPVHPVRKFSNGMKEKFGEPKEKPRPLGRGLNGVYCKSKDALRTAKIAERIIKSYEK